MGVKDSGRNDRMSFLGSFQIFSKAPEETRAGELE
jgi:hypothetical protein